MLYRRVLKFIKWKTSVRNITKYSNEMKYLNVAEKHDAAKTIAGLLSNGSARRREGYSVYNKIFDFEATVKGSKCKMVMTSVSGHLMQLEFLVGYRNWRNVDPKQLFDAPLRKTCNEDFQPIKRTLEREIRHCQGLIVWTDCDREGENIGYEIIDVCRAIKPNIAVYRAHFSEITTASVRRALQQLGVPDKRQSDAVDIRTELDLRTGAAITRFQTMRLQRLFPEKIADKLISYGSCQIPTLGFVAERYKEVEAFISEPFWKIKVTHTIDDLTVEFNWARNRLFDKQACEDYLVICLAEPIAKVEVVTVKPKHKWRPTPMDTVEMEKLGSRKLKLSAKETMTIAEKLYTKGIISYPRTETNQFSKEFDLRTLVEQQTSHSVWGEFAQRVMEWGPNPRNGNKSDQAHPPIHPTKLVTNLTGNEARIYELIVRHFLACVSKDAVGSETVVHINIAGEKFTATGLCIYERNYLDVYIYDKWNAKQIHKYEQGQTFEPTEITMQEGATTAPPLLTEADLIALMEKHGIGTDATHAEHINTIKERGYIGVVDNGCLVPGVIGMGLYEGYDAMELVLAKPVLRAGFEADLKKICLGEKDPKVVLSEQIVKYKAAYQQIMEKITAMDEKISQRINETPTSTASNNGGGNASNAHVDDENNLNRMQELFQCPKCNVAPLALKSKKNQTGHYIGCLNFPDCKNAIWLSDECKEPTVLDETCQRCGNNFKMLKFKFNIAYYKSLFNAPFGWYKTCLRCDQLFRDTFNINLDSVKRLGNIVSDTASANVPLPTTAPSNNPSNSWNDGPSSSGINGNRAKKSQQPKKKPDIGTETKRKKTTTSTRKKPTTTQNNIRNFFTDANSNDSASTINNEATATAHLHDIPMDEFFDSNDGFDELIMNTDPSVLTNINAVRTAPSSDTSAITIAAGFTDDIAAAFAADDDEDFADFDLGNSAGNAPPHPPPSPPGGGASCVRTPNTTTNTNSNINRNFRMEFDDSFSSVFRQNDDNLDDFAWGSAARAKLTPNGPAAKKQRIAQPVPAINFNESGDADLLGSNQNTVRCSGCHQVAKLCSSRNDGPHKGRQFYVCPKSNSCKFFQWADEEPNSFDRQSSNSSWKAKKVENKKPHLSQSSDGWGSSTSSAGSSRETVPNGGVQCKCGKPAKSLTVRKDGPNQGRPFYNCATNRDCGFFKWGDEDDANRATSSTESWGSNRSNQNSANFRTTSQGTEKNDNKKRKCGLCRKEGHTKTKCPLKTQFDY